MNTIFINEQYTYELQKIQDSTWKFKYDVLEGNSVKTESCVRVKGACSLGNHVRLRHQCKMSLIANCCAKIYECNFAAHNGKSRMVRTEIALKPNVGEEM